MAEKRIRFEARTTQTRYYDIPYNKAIEIIKGDGEDCSEWNEQDIADHLNSIHYFEMADYEEEDFYVVDSEVIDVEIYEN